MDERVPMTSMVIAIEKLSTSHALRSASAPSNLMAMTTPYHASSATRRSGTSSVGDDDDTRWRVQERHRTFRRSVDVDSRLAGKLLLVVRAPSVELAVAQHDAAFAEHRTLELCDR